MLTLCILNTHMCVCMFLCVTDLHMHYHHLLEYNHHHRINMFSCEQTTHPSMLNNEEISNFYKLQKGRRQTDHLMTHLSIIIILQDFLKILKGTFQNFRQILNKCSFSTTRILMVVAASIHQLHYYILP